MSKRNLRKALAATLAGTMALTLMPMSAFASGSGEINVDVGTVETIVRVQVPTDMAISLDEFEQQATGTQIYSDDFTIKNLSSTAVKVNISSTANTASGVTLTTKSNVDSANEAWLAVAAAVSGTSSNYKYYTTVSGSADDYSLLDDSSTNVTAFSSVSDDYVATQNFYLDKASGTKKYTAVSGVTDITQYAYAELYELKAKDSSITDDATLKNYIATSGSVYTVTGDVATKLAGTETYGSSTTYYCVPNDAAVATTLASEKQYVYAEVSTASTNGETAFRYIGKLGDRSSEATDWTDTDISDINIKYTIKSLSGTDYTADSEGCVMGYKASSTEEAPVFTTVAGGKITYTTGSGDLALSTVTSIKITNDLGTFDALVALDGYYAAATTSNNTITLDSDYVEFYNGGEQVTITYTNTNGDTKTDTSTTLKK